MLNFVINFYIVKENKQILLNECYVFRYIIKEFINSILPMDVVKINAGIKSAVTSKARLFLLLFCLRL
jgi:hypothetical protein